MKKITAFFMAFLPFFVVILLFISGMIVKNNTHVWVSAVEIVQTNEQVLKETAEINPTIQLEANVLPLNATHPEVTWSVSNPDIIQVNNEGLVTCKDWGEAYVYATSKENQTLSAACKIDVYDTKIHQVAVSNTYDASYIGQDSRLQLKVQTKPSLTHIKDATMTFEAQDPQDPSKSSDVIDVTNEGLVIPKNKEVEAGKINQAKVVIKAGSPTNLSEQKQTEVMVNVGKGIDAISFNNTGKEVTPNPEIDLFEDLEVSPDSKKQLVENGILKPTDFTYTCDKNNTYVSIKEDGKCQFLLPCTANFTATYKRNPNLKTSKTIECTCNQLKHVYFSNERVDLVYGQDETIEANKLEWYVYPYTPKDGQTYRDVDGVEIISSNSKVINVREGNSNPLLEVKSAGDAVLTARVKISENTYTSDSCLVHVALPSKGLLREESFTTDSCYFPLRKAINLPEDKQTSEKLIYVVSHGIGLVTKDDNEILHFKQPGEAKILVRKEGAPSEDAEEFSVTSTAQPVEKDITERIIIPVGQITKLADGYKGVFKSEAYEDKFDVSEDGTTFIAKCGQNIEQFKITNGTTSKAVQLVVTEDPLYIQAEVDPLYITAGTGSILTSDTTVDVANEVNAKIIPETATYPDGSKYAFNYDYEWQAGQVAGSIENDVATFTKAGILNAKVEVDVPENNKTISQTYSIFCTHGNSLGKFKITESAEQEAPAIKQYDEFSILPGASKVLYCDTGYAQTDSINAESTTGLCSVVKNYSALEGTTFTITAPATKSGLDVIKISTETYSVFVRINVDAVATDLILTKSGVELDSTNTTYTKKLQFKALALPATVKEADIACKFNNADLPTIKSGDYIDLSEASWNDGDNTLIVKCGNIEKTYTLKYKSEVQTQDIKLVGVDDKDKSLYLNSYSTNKVCEFDVGGFVDDNWFNENITAEVTVTPIKTLPPPTISYNYLSITGISIPDTEIAETYTLTLKRKDEAQPFKTYTLERDMVAKIEFPGHDNSDMTDKKGLQKVHVYGNHSYYPEDKKEVDYYKLPVNVYIRGNDGKLILVEDKQAKYQVLQTLKPSFGKSSATSTINENGFIEIRFNQNDLYSWDDITNDRFDSKANRNVTFTLSSRSGDAKASYTFVATNGINQYCQEGLRASHDKKLSSKNNIFQTNFGLPSGSKENAPLTDIDLKYLGNVMGNGYTINFNERYTKRPGNVDFMWALNTTVQCCDDSSLSWDKLNMSMSDDEDVGEGRQWIWKYLTIKNFPHGIYFADDGVTDRKINKCLMTGSLEYSILANESNEKIYIEDCIFFNSGSFTFYTFLGAELYFKGFIDIYNFHGQEMLQHLAGYDLRSLWTTLTSAARLQDGVHTDAAGKDCINSFMVTFNSAGVHFWNNQTAKYEQALHGLPGSAEHVAKLVDMTVKFAGLEFGIWGTKTSNVDPTGPKYSDEYNPDGSISIEFLNNQINKIKRHINYF